MWGKKNKNEFYVPDDTDQDFLETGGSFALNPDEQYTTEDSVDIAPKDRFSLVYCIMFLQGAGLLFPWNSFISAPDYFG